jgi:ABC-type multidrug transport system fused ATPase/permease subunit
MCFSSSWCFHLWSDVVRIQNVTYRWTLTNRTRFVGEVYMQIPMRIQVPSVIFAKSMRKKDIKGAAKKTDKALDDQVSSEENSLIKKDDAEDEDDEIDELKKSRQGVVNLVGVDTKRMADFAILHNYLFGAIIKLGIAFYFLYRIVGWQSLLVGLACQLLFMPLNIYFSKRYTVFQDKLMKARDRKLAVVNEALTGIRQIKFSALEQKWHKKIMGTRENELKTLWQTMMADVVLISLWIAGPVLLSAGCIVTHALIYGSLDPATAFTTVSLLTRIEGTLSYLPELTTNGLDAWVSFKRIRDYLAASEKEAIVKDGDRIAFDDATIAWPSDEIDEDTFKLHNVILDFPRGELSVISGRTGSGKSLLLSAILGECEVLSGSITVPRSPSVEERNDKAANQGNWILPNAVAFVSQIPWIENCSLRDNILFGLPYDEQRYQKVIDDCALTKDLGILVDGDKTEIGPNGINLSGGQCWRLTLARALYSRAGILVLDDIFSAVDAHVGKHIYENALTGSICEGRTRILVSHHVALCRPKTKYEVRLGNGGVEYAGNVEDMERTGILKKVMEEQEEAIEVDDDDDLERTLTSDEIQRRLSSVSRRLSKTSANGSALQVASSKRRPSKAGSNRALVEEDTNQKDGKANPKKFVEEEERETGSVRFRIYLQYLRACGGFWFWMGVVILFLGFEALLLGRVSNLDWPDDKNN